MTTDPAALIIEGNNRVTLKVDPEEAVNIQGSYNASISATKLQHAYTFLFYVLLFIIGVLFGYYHMWRSMVPRHPLL